MILRAGLAYALAFDDEAGMALEAVFPAIPPSLVGERAAKVDDTWNFEALAVDIGGFRGPVADEKLPE